MWPENRAVPISPVPFLLQTAFHLTLFRFVFPVNASKHCTQPRQSANSTDCPANYCINVYGAPNPYFFDFPSTSLRDMEMSEQQQTKPQSARTLPKTVILFLVLGAYLLL